MPKRSQVSIVYSNCFNSLSPVETIMNSSLHSSPLTTNVATLLAVVFGMHFLRTYSIRYIKHKKLEACLVQNENKCTFHGQISLEAIVLNAVDCQHLALLFSGFFWFQKHEGTTVAANGSSSYHPLQCQLWHCELNSNLGILLNIFYTDTNITKR